MSDEAPSPAARAPADEMRLVAAERHPDPEVARLFRARRAAGEHAYVLTLSDAELAALRERRHEIGNAVRGFGTIVGLVQSGYRFDDEHAASYVDALAAHVAALRDELARWDALGR